MIYVSYNDNFRNIASHNINPIPLIIINAVKSFSDLFILTPRKLSISFKEGAEAPSLKTYLINFRKERMASRSWLAPISTANSVSLSPLVHPFFFLIFTFSSPPRGLSRSLYIINIPLVAIFVKRFLENILKN